LLLTAEVQTIKAVCRTDNDGVCVFKNYMHVSKVKDQMSKFSVDLSR